jgi:hypothetical protein
VAVAAAYALSTVADDDERMLLLHMQAARSLRLKLDEKRLRLNYQAASSHLLLPPVSLQRRRS